MQRLCASVLALVLLLTGCGVAETTRGIEVRDAWVRAVVADTNPTISAAYLVIRNTKDTPDRLLKIESDRAADVEMHATIEENGVFQMRPVQQIDIPANGELAFTSGGYHLMLIGVTGDLAVGDTVNLTLLLENTGTVRVAATVRVR
jgi:periplasmic copper chaperone A